MAQVHHALSGRQRSTGKRRRSDRQAHLSKSEDFDSAPASPADTASNVSESTKDLSSKLESDSDFDDASTDSSWRKQTLIAISEFVKRFSSKKIDKIFKPDMSAVIYSKDNNKQIRFGYQDLIKQTMSLDTVRRRVDSGQISNQVELKRDFVLMLVNASMFNNQAETEVR